MANCVLRRGDDESTSSLCTPVVCTDGQTFNRGGEEWVAPWDEGGDGGGSAGN